MEDGCVAGLVAAATAFVAAAVETVSTTAGVSVAWGAWVKEGIRICMQQSGRGDGPAWSVQMDLRLMELGSLTIMLEGFSPTLRLVHRP